LPIELTDLDAAPEPQPASPEIGDPHSVGHAQHGHSEDDLRYVRRRYLTAEAARSIAVEIANATFAARAQSGGDSATRFSFVRLTSLIGYV
jgi:hypothetical protein